ncbi:hypothetical protein F7725_008954 [Dissostichus mawsoni]|uniref:PH domain-containing protein n=1 Tax=Dissostichus mawsoni TaxID=36200 RepID=A0A7J5Z5Q5_DISMA|nr:hypothetical protein F7725_008954 [Dissostichus mawsoni]
MWLFVYIKLICVVFDLQEFIRLGCLSKLSGKGLQQRMFFLFSDSLVYTSRGMTPSNQFKVHGQMPLYGMTIRESEEEWGVPHSFTLFGQRQSLVVAASCASEMERWVEDIRMAIDLAEQSSSPTSDLLSTSPTDNSESDYKHCISLKDTLYVVHLYVIGIIQVGNMAEQECLSEDGSLEVESEDELCGSPSGTSWKHNGSRVLHRNTSVSMVDFSVAVENQLSGNLLRKFKTDEYPLASLPLLGYSVTVPAESENIHKDYVFKLHFKSHVYYFRSESEYTFESALIQGGNALKFVQELQHLLVHFVDLALDPVTLTRGVEEERDVVLAGDNQRVFLGGACRRQELRLPVGGV